jgi:negative regulator of flagellin synthesis FlgM
MKIGHPADKPLPVPPTGTTTVASETAKAATGAVLAGVEASAPDASATVALSSTASTLLLGGSSAEFDAEKVARISQSIADGSFKVNPEVIADKLIANAQELLGKAKG